MQAHRTTAEQLANKKADLLWAKSKLKVTNTDLEKAKSNFDVTTKNIDGHTLTLANKDTELLKLREELKDARDRELDDVAEYHKSMDFVTRLANRYNGGWAATMRCARHAFPDIY